MSDLNTISAIEQGPFAGGLDYPFVSQSLLSAAVIDAKVLFDPVDAALPFFLHGSIAAGGGISLSLRDSDDQEVLSLTPGNLTQNYADGPAGHRMVKYTDGTTTVWLELDDSVMATSSSPERLDVRVLCPILPAISSLSFKTCKGLESADKLLASDIDQLQFREGNNVEWSADGQSFRVNAEAGSGLGRNNNCNDLSDLIYTVAGVRPVNGNLVLSKNQCYRIEPAYELDGNDRLVVPGELHFYQDCEPCCDCSEFAALALAVADQNRVTKYKESRLSDAINLHNDLVKSLSDGFRNAPSLTLAIGRAAGCQMSISAAFTNREPVRIESLKLKFTLEDDTEGKFFTSTIKAAPTSAAVYCDGSYIADATVSQPNGYTLHIDVGSVDPGQSVTVAFYISVDETAMYRVCGSLRGGISDAPATCQIVSIVC